MSNLGNLDNFINENWHGGQIQGDFFNHPEMNIEENLKVAKIKKASIWNWKHAITRELMRGHHKKDILFKYKDIINKFNLQEKIIAFIDKYDGVLGYFIVDVSNFDNKFTYNDIPSFMKECNLYAINATELREIISRSLISENDGSLDGFFDSKQNIKEEIHYIDEYTGLPCIDNINTDIDNEDERLDKIANLFLNRKIISIAEKSNFNNLENKFNYLVSVLKKSFKLKSNSENNKIENDISNYNLQNYNLKADTQKQIKSENIDKLKESKIDEISIKDNKKSDFPDIEIKESKIDKISIKDNKKLNIENKNKKSDFISDIEIKENKYDVIDDNIKELSKKDFKEDITFNNTQNFVIEDIKDMKDDEFDYADLNNGDVNLDEMFILESDDKQVDIDKKPEQFEIDRKSDWIIDL